MDRSLLQHCNKEWKSKLLYLSHIINIYIIHTEGPHLTGFLLTWISPQYSFGLGHTTGSSLTLKNDALYLSINFELYLQPNQGTIGGHRKVGRFFH